MKKSRSERREEKRVKRYERGKKIKQDEKNLKLTSVEHKQV